MILALSALLNVANQDYSNFGATLSTVLAFITLFILFIFPLILLTKLRNERTKLH